LRVSSVYNVPAELFDTGIFPGVKIANGTEPISQQSRGGCKQAGVTGGSINRRIYPDTEPGYLPADVPGVDQSIKLIDFPWTHIAGIEAVFTGVTIARLTASFTFFHITSPLAPSPCTEKGVGNMFTVIIAQKFW
jgi:hypothetical protein